MHSLQNQTFKDWELLVLDNASVDNSVALVEEYWPPATIIKQKQNIGFARGHNLLVKWSKSDYVLVLNQDVILEPDYIEKLVNFLDRTFRKQLQCLVKYFIGILRKIKRLHR